MDEKYLLSTDIGSDIDDALALLTILNSNMNLQGIYTVNGDVITRGYIAKQMTNLAGICIEIANGESEPLEGGITPYSNFEASYVDDGFIETRYTKYSITGNFKAPGKVGIRSDGVKAMSQKLASSPHTILSIGPMTNIAKLIDDYPDVINNINHLYVMGCRFSEHPDSCVLEHNVRYDIPAAIKVFESEIPLTVIPGDLTSQYLIDLNQLDSMHTMVGRYVKHMAKGFLGIKTAYAYISSGLEDMIKENALIHCFSENQMQGAQLLNFFNQFENLFNNIGSSYHAISQPSRYFEDYMNLIEILQETRYDYNKGREVASILQDFIPENISVADVYVPYCVLRQDKIKTKKNKVIIEYDGHSKKTPGDKHTIVTTIDHEDFKEFLDSYFK